MRDGRRLAGRAAVVTGAAGGLGRAVAERFADEGARVALLDLAEADAEKAALEIRARGGEALALGCDVSDADSVGAAAVRLVAQLGPPAALCNAAGIQRYARTEEETLESWSRILAVNLTGTFLVCRALLPSLLETRGAIVNVSSMAGLRGLPYDAAYCASKGGVILLTRSLAKEFSDRGVRANAVAPGAVRTGMLGLPFPEDANPEVMKTIPRTPWGVCEPEVVASTVAYLASDDAAHVTGAVIPIDGGLTA